MRRSIIIAILFLSTMLVDIAQACRAGIFELSLFIEPPLTGVTADVIAEVTITEIVPPEGLILPRGVNAQYYQVAVAHVQKVIKGDLRESVVKIANGPTSCGPLLDRRSIGYTGIVAGKIGRDSQGMTVLEVRGESSYQRDRRLGSAMRQSDEAR